MRSRYAPAPPIRHRTHAEGRSPMTRGVAEKSSDRAEILWVSIPSSFRRSRRWEFLPLSSLFDRALATARADGIRRHDDASGQIKLGRGRRRPKHDPGQEEADVRDPPRALPPPRAGPTSTTRAGRSHSPPSRATLPRGRTLHALSRAVDALPPPRCTRASLAHNHPAPLRPQRMGRRMRAQGGRPVLRLLRVHLRGLQRCQRVRVVDLLVVAARAAAAPRPRRDSRRAP